MTGPDEQPPRAAPGARQRESVSAIVPTIGRPASLARLLASLAAQTRRIDEVVIADAGADGASAAVIADPRWRAAGLEVRRIAVAPPHAVRQREAAIAASSGALLLLLDDDVELEPDCLAQLEGALADAPDSVAAMADFSNQRWPGPTRAWRLYLRLAHGLADGDWQGRVIGPLLRFGFDPPPRETRRIEWIGAGNTLLRRAAFERAGGFSSFFLDRAATHEDVDLGLRLSRIGPLLFCPQARLAHFHDPAGRLSLRAAAEDDLHNRYCVLRFTLGRSRPGALAAVLGYAALESASNAAGAARRGRAGAAPALLAGRLRALARLLRAEARRA
jgi:GT2 family glycosyltransferase